MRLAIILNASVALDSPEAFAGMLRHIADTIEDTSGSALDTALYDAAMVRVGYLTLIGAASAPSQARH